MTSYPVEAQKVRFIAWFWVILNTGAVVGSLVPLGENIHTITNSNVLNGTYIGGCFALRRSCDVADVHQASWFSCLRVSSSHFY